MNTPEATPPRDLVLEWTQFRESIGLNLGVEEHVPRERGDVSLPNRDAAEAEIHRLRRELDDARVLRDACADDLTELLDQYGAPPGGAVLDRAERVLREWAQLRSQAEFGREADREAGRMVADLLDELKVPGREYGTLARIALLAARVPR